MATLFERVVSAVFGAPAAAVNGADRELIDDAVDAFIETVEPRVRLRSGYRKQLAPGMSRTVEYLRALGQQPLPTLSLARASWSTDPAVRAFFAAADEVPACLGRSDELRAYFDEHPGCDEAYALLGMQRRERQVLASQMVDGQLRRDVAQTTVNFDGHRLLAPHADLAQTRLEIGRRIIQRLAQLVLARVVAAEQQAQDDAQRRACLTARLRMLHRTRDGLGSLVGSGADLAQQIADAERALQAAGGAQPDTPAGLDGCIEQMNAVLTQPDQHVALNTVPLRMNRMGVKVDAPDADADTLSLAELSIGDGLCATIALVRIARSELPPRQALLAQAERLL